MSHLVNTCQLIRLDSDLKSFREARNENLLDGECADYSIRKMEKTCGMSAFLNTE